MPYSSVWMSAPGATVALMIGWIVVVGSKREPACSARKGARHSQKSRYSNAELTTTPAKLVPAIHSMAKGSWLRSQHNRVWGRPDDGSRA
jgi:hypothetical protein